MYESMISKEIKKICIFLVALLATVLLLDNGIGYVFDSLLERLPNEGERVAKSNYVITKVKSDIVIIGSSRAECHYDSKMIQEAMPTKTVFNCGVDGALFFYELAAFNAILDRYTPEMIIWDMQIDELKSNQSENLGLLYPYYKKNINMRDFLNEREPRLKYMIWLNAYRFNATGSRILRSLNLRDNNLMGFVGKESADATRKVEHKTVQQNETTLDSVKIELLKKALSRAKAQGSQLIIVQSPYYYKFEGESSTTKMIRKLCAEYGVRFIDDTQLPDFVGNNEMIYDAGHLKIEGARRFTQILLEQLSDEGDGRFQQLYNKD